MGGIVMHHEMWSTMKDEREGRYDQYKVVTTAFSVV